MPNDDYDSVTARIYKKDRRKLLRLQLKATERHGRKVSLAELVGDAVKLLEDKERQRKERDLAR